MKKNWKILAAIALAILCIAGVILGITLGGSGQVAGPERGKTTISVEGPNGASVEEVYVMLYDKDGKPLTKLPYVTNASGKIQYHYNVGEGSYVQVVSVPIGYKLDESVKWTFNEKGEANIAVDEDDTAFVAKIGEKKYSSFTVALATANAASEDVVVELLADVTFNTATIKNNYNKTITVKGNGHTITSGGGNHAFLLEQAEGEVIFENMTIVHNNYGSVFQMNSLMTLTATDVVLDATKGSAYNYALINTLGVDGTTTVNLTNVDAKMAVSSSGKSDQSAIIRTGNTTGTKNVVLNLKGCNFDTTEATGRCGIIVMKNTVADINIEDSNIVAGDAYAIWAMEQTKMQTMTVKNSTFVSTLDGFKDKALNGYTARMGNTYYLTFKHAAEVANVATADTKISLVGNVTMNTCTINNVNGKTVTIDGEGKTLTTSGTSNAFVVGNKVAFENIIINHQNNGSVIQATEIAQITAKNVVINATEGEKYNYTLVNLMAEGEGSSIDFTNVDIKMAVDSKGLDGYASLIRTGNDPEVKKVAITLTNCNLDATGAEGRVGIAVTKNTTATITLNNTKIATKDAYVIRTNEQEVILNNATLTSLDEAKQIYPMEGYLAKIDNTFYTFAKALEVANAATTDTKITLLANYTIKEYTLNNANGKTVEFDGNGYKITTSGGNNAFTIGKNVTFKNLAVNHKNQGSVFQITEAGKIVLDKVDISAKEGSKYNYALINVMPKDAETTLELNNVSAVMSVAGRGVADTAIIRTGNDGQAKTVNISLNGCNFDTTKATGRAGILVMTKTTANITMTDTNIKTLDAPSVQSKESGVAQGIVIKNCNLDSDTKEYNAKNEPIRGYESMVTKYEKPVATFTLAAPIAEKEEDTSIKEAVIYARLHDAVDAVRYSKDDVKIDLIKDFTRGWQFSLKSDYGINILIDGNGHTLTTKGGSNVFCVYDPKSVEIKDLTVKHTNSGAVVSIRDEVTGDVQVDLNNVVIEAVNPETNYDYALINVLRSATLNLNKVEATMEVDVKGKDGNAAIIRTGNNAKEELGIVKEVEINIVDSKLDTTEATERKAIVIMRGTDADVTIENSKVLTMDVNAIKTEEVREGTLTVSDSKVVSGKADTIDKDFEIQVGDTWYLNEGMGILGAIENATEDTTIQVSQDLELDFNELASTSDAKVTLEAGEFTITTTGEKDENIEIISDVVVASGDTTYYTGVDQFIDVLNKVEDDTDICINADTSLNFDEVIIDADIELTVDTNGNSLQVIGDSAQNVTYISEVEYTAGDVVYYTTFKKAAVLGQTAEDDVVINMKADATITSTATTTGATIKNSNGKHIVINGNDKTLTAKGGNCSLLIQKAASVTIRDITIKHENYGSAVDINATTTVNLENVDIDATNPANSESNYKYAIINFTVVSDTEKAFLNMKNVDVTMASAKNGSDGNPSIIRTGNNDQTKTVVITMDGCTLDATGAAGRAGIRIMQKTTATIDIKNTVIKTKDVSPIVNNGTGDTITKTGVVVSTDTELGTYATLEAAIAAVNEAEKDVIVEFMADTTIESALISNKNGKAVAVNGNGHTITATGTDAFVVNQTGSVTFSNIEIIATNGTPIKNASGNTINENGHAVRADGYLLVSDNFANAVTAANGAASDVVLEMAGDVTITGTATKAGATFKNANGKNITIDGKNHTLTAKDGNCSLLIQNTGDVTIKDLIIKHENYGSALDINETTTVNLENVDIDATNPANSESNYKYAIINFTVVSTTDTAFLNMKDVDVIMASTKNGSDSHAGIIRTGNNDQTKTVVISMDGCTLDATGAAGRAGIRIMQNTTATIDLQNTVIKTNNVSPIVNNGTGDTITKTGVVVSTETELGTYATLEAAIEAANKATKDVVVEFNEDIEEFTTVIIKNENGKAVTVNGNGHTITATGGDDKAAFVVNQNSPVTFANMKLTVEDGSSGIYINKDTTAIINLENTEIRTTNVGPIVDASTGATITKTGIVVSSDKELAAYATLKAAIEAVNAATSNVVVEFNTDIALEETLTIKNDNGVTVTVKGNGKTITKDGESDEPVFVIDQTAPVNFENVKLDQKDAGFVIEITEDGIINLKNTELKTTGTNLIDDNETGATVNKNGCTVSASGYLAVCDTLENAITYANLATSNVVVEINGDTTLTTAAINNIEGNKVTVRGNGYKITSNGENYAFIIGQLSPVVFENLTIDYQNSGSAIQVVASGDVTFTEVTIKTKDAAPIVDNSGNATIHMDGVVVKTDNEVVVCATLEKAIELAKSATKDVVIELNGNATLTTAIIKNENGNAVTVNGNGYTITATGGSNDAAFVVDQNAPVNFTNTKITVGAGSTGILIPENTTATINLTNTEIKTTDVSPIVDESTKAIINKNGIVVSSATDLAAYDTLEAAIAAANTATNDVVVEVNADINHTSAIIQNENDKAVTVNGNGHKITATGGSDKAAFVVKQTGSVSFNDIEIVVANGTPIKNESGATINENGYVVRADGYLMICDTFVEAIAAANSAIKNVVVELYKDTDITSVEINNANEYEVALDGKGFTITATGGSNEVAFVVKQTAPVSFSNVEITVANGTPIKKESASATIKENGYVVRADRYLLVSDTLEKAIEAANDATGSVVVDINEDTTLTASVIINNKAGNTVTVNGNGHTTTLEGENNNAVFVVEQTSPVTFNEAKIMMVTENTVTNGGIICAGMDGQTKAVEIILNECTLDATGAEGVSGIRIMSNATATINLNNTEIKTKGADAVVGTATIVNNSGIVVSTGKELAAYETLKEAIEAANAATSDVVVEFNQDITLLESLTIKNNNGATITLRGKSKTITKQGGSDTPAFVIDQIASVNFENLKLDQKDGGSAIEITKAGVINLNNIELKATVANPINDNETGATINKNGCIVSAQGFLGVYDTLEAAVTAANLATSNVVIDLNGNTILTTATINNIAGHEVTVRGNGNKITASGEYAFIVGQGAPVNFENLTLDYKNAASAIQVVGSGAVTLTEVTIDAIAGGNGILVMETSAATINLINSEIKTNNASPIVNNSTSATIKMDGVVVRANGQLAVYENLELAIAAVANATKDVVVEFTEDITITETLTINNANGALITLNGNGKTITKEGTSDTPVFIVAQNTSASFENMKLDQKNGGSAIEVADDGTINLADIEITTTSAKPIADNDAATIIKDGTAVSTSRYLAVCDKLEDAITYANLAEDNVVVEINEDITLTTATINNINGYKVTVKGNVVEGRKPIVTSAGGSNNHSFIIGQTEQVLFEDFTLVHRNFGSAIQVTVLGDVIVDNVTIDATQPDNKDPNGDYENNYSWALINFDVSGNSEINLKLVDTDITMATTKAGRGSCAIIRTGNDNQTKNIVITLEGCTLDATGTTGRAGIRVMKGTTATINLTNTEITTKDVKPIEVKDGANATINKNGVAVSSDRQLTVCATLEAAIASANLAKRDVVVELNGDIPSFTTANIHNENGKVVTINGNGHTITADGGDNNAAFVVTEGGTVNFVDTDITMSGVNANIANPAIIRIDDGAAIITLDKSVLDARGSSGRAGIRVMQNAFATINLKSTGEDTDNIKSTEIKVQDACPIWDGSTAGVTIIRDKNYKASSETHLAQVGNNLFTAFTGTTGVFNSTGIGANKIEDKNVVIEFLKDFEGSSALIENPYGKTVTIEGNGHTLTTAANQNHTLRAKQTAPVSINNLTIVHRGSGAAFQLETLGTLNFTNVTINATNPVNSDTNYNYAIINLTGVSGEINLNLTNTHITMASTKAGLNNNGSIIRTGNDTETKTVNLTVKGCTLDATGATGRSGIVIMRDTTANVTVEDSEIKTLNDFPIMDRSAGKSTVNKIRTKIAITGDAYKDYVALVGKTYPEDKEANFSQVLYDNFEYTIETLARNATSDTVIEVLKDVVVSESFDINNLNGYDVTIDGNNYNFLISKKTASGSVGNHGFRIGSSPMGIITLKNMKVDHRNYGSFLQITSNVTKSELAVNLIDIELNATSPDDTGTNKGYKYAIIAVESKYKTILSATRVDITMATPEGNTNLLGTSGETAILRTGNNNTDSTKELELIMEDCNWDAAGAAERSGILIIDAEVSITMRNSQIKTGKGASQSGGYSYTAIQGATKTSSSVNPSGATKTLTLIMDANSLLQAGDSTAQADTIKDVNIISITGYPQDAAINAVGLDDEMFEEIVEQESQEEGTITITLEVPENLFELFEVWIRQFAETYGWELEF